MKEEKAWRGAAAARGCSSRSGACSAVTAVVPARLAAVLSRKVRWALSPSPSAPESALRAELPLCAGAGGSAFWPGDSVEAGWGGGCGVLGTNDG